MGGSTLSGSRHKLYNGGLILLYVSEGAAKVKGVEVYRDKTVVSDLTQLVVDARQKSSTLKLQIGWLRIIAHGNPHAVKIGNSFVSERTIESYKSTFNDLGRLLNSQAVVELYSCQTGLSDALLLAISAALNRPVLAYKAIQSGTNLSEFKWAGDAKICVSGICQTVDNQGVPRQ
jgi:hypothetical protein